MNKKTRKKTPQQKQKSLMTNDDQNAVNILQSSIHKLFNIIHSYNRLNQSVNL